MGSLVIRAAASSTDLDFLAPPAGRQQFTIGQNKGVIAASYERIKSMIETERD